MSGERTERFDRLVRLLKELFQLDKPDLDFGFYRIMHAKASEVTRFLEVDLLPQLRDAFQQYSSADRATLEQQLAEAERGARELGVDPNAVPKVQELRKAIDAGTDVDALEADVYDHLYRFFRRYYSEGDFISQRVYKDGVYAIPYQGEEVKLYWANADQYYIKTTEYLKDYSFRLHPEAESDPMRVHFRLADAAEGEHGNIKATDEKARRFVLAEDFIAEEEGPDGVRELVIRFEYRAATLGDWPKQKRKGKKRPPQQKDLNEAAVTAVLDANDLSLARWMKELDALHVKADGSQAGYTRLRSHLDRYTARNTYDYFIHKDLGGFLRRELDFYVKNEVMHLDDIEHETVPRVEEWLSQIKVIRAIAHEIIDFLAQLEGFQKKLWLKKKFVVETSYCVAVGSIPGDFHAEVVANRAQHDEWVDLHGIDEFAGDLARAGYSDPLTTEFLRAHPTLMVDTRHFGSRFTEQIIAALDNVDDRTTGLVVQSDNFQALSLLQMRYRERFKCAYVDPPYNTDAGPIDYKNGYRRSSWMSLIANCLPLARQLLSDDGVFCITIDDYQVHELASLIEREFGRDKYLGTVAIRNNPSGRSTLRGLSVCHEYAFLYANGSASLERLPRTEKQLSRFSKEADGYVDWRNFRKDGGSVTHRAARPKQYYPIYVRLADKALRIPALSWNRATLAWDILEEPTEEESVLWPIDEKDQHRVWSLNHISARENVAELEVRLGRGGATQIYRRHRPAAGVLPRSWWDKRTYAAREYGSATLGKLFGSTPFSFAKSPYAVQDCLRVSGLQTCLDGGVVDYFAGSGTTAHAVIETNREDGGQRKFFLVEMSQYFDTVLLPRIKKVTFTPEWKDGKPKRLATPAETKRSPRIVKVVRLESYEDTLNNLVVHRPEQVQRLLDENIDGGTDAAREDYIIRYMLDVETGDSPSLLDLSAFLDPSAYHLRVKRPGSDESRDVVVDLVETFNWLLGLRVIRMSAPKRYDAEFGDAGQSNSPATVVLKENPDGPWWFRTVEGVLPDERRALVIWRHRPSGDEPDGIERDNAVLDEWFKQSGHHARQADFDLIYANGDHNLDSLQETGQTWTGHTIEDHFKRLMFEDSGEGAGAW